MLFTKEFSQRPLPLLHKKSLMKSQRKLLLMIEAARKRRTRINTIQSKEKATLIQYRAQTLKLTSNQNLKNRVMFLLLNKNLLIILLRPNLKAKIRVATAPGKSERMNPYPIKKAKILLARKVMRKIKTQMRILKRRVKLRTLTQTKAILLML